MVKRLRDIVEVLDRDKPTIHVNPSISDIKKHTASSKYKHIKYAVYQDGSAHVGDAEHFYTR